MRTPSTAARWKKRSNKNAAYEASAATMATTVENKHNNTAEKCTIRYLLSFHYEKLGSVVHLVAACDFFEQKPLSI
jgi:hypothetical protein